MIEGIVEDMELSLHKENLKKYLQRQLENHFPDRKTGKYFRGKDVDHAFDMGLCRLENCFKHVILPAYSNDAGQTFFSHLHSDQYAQFLYYFMNSLWKESQNRLICDKTMLLLRDLNGIFMTYKCEMPDIFLFQHAVGTVVGNAVFSDYLLILQNVTINTGVEQDRLGTVKIGRGVTRSPGAKIISDEPIGDRVNIGVDAVVYKTKIENDKTVIRDREGKIVIRDNKFCMAQRHFRDVIT